MQKSHDVVIIGAGPAGCTAGAELAKAGFDFRAGLEVEFHLFKLENPRLAPADATWPPEAPQVSLLTQGYQYLTESRFDLLDPALEILRHGIEKLAQRLDTPCGGADSYDRDVGVRRVVVGLLLRHDPPDVTNGAAARAAEVTLFS